MTPRKHLAAGFTIALYGSDWIVSPSTLGTLTLAAEHRPRAFWAGRFEFTGCALCMRPVPLALVLELNAANQAISNLEH